MPKFTVNSPDGQTFTVNAPEGSTEQQAIEYVQKNLYKPAAASSGNITNNMSATETTLAGIGRGMSSAVRALGGGSLLGKFGLPSTQEEAALVDKDLMATTAGKIGSGIGMGAVAAPAALVPGANTYLGATGLGAITGAALTEGDVGDRSQGAAFGAAGGAVGKGLGDLLGWGVGKLLASRFASRSAAEVANAQKDAAFKTAQANGYVVPPSDVKTGFVNEALNGLSGKIKTAQVASQRNQTVTNSMAKKALGIPDDVPLNAQTLNAVRIDAGRAYSAVDGVGTVTPGRAYTDALDAIVKPYQSASRSFPSAKPNPIIDEINTLRTGAFDAGDAIAKIRTLRADAESAYAKGDKDIGKALKAGADALEQAIDDHVASFGPSQLLANFRDARKLIAKTYTVQKGLNDTTGDVSSLALANQLKKGKPLSGELRTIAQVAEGFPKATQLLKEAPKSVSPLDYAVGAMTGASTGNPLMLGTMMARPMTRSMILSKPYQSNMMNNTYTGGLLDDYVLPALQTDAAKKLMFTGGITGGLLTN